MASPGLLSGFPRPEGPRKTKTFICPYGTFDYRRIGLWVCNGNIGHVSKMYEWQIFHDMIEKTMEVFMDDFSVFGDSFSTCLSHLDKMLKWCEDTNLVLNWEKSHFMVKEGIVLGHKISKSGIEVDRAKVDVIAKLPHPTTVKGVRSFLGHAGFYRRFIQDFSKIARPMTHLLEKETPFFFSKECIESFNTLKRKLTEAPILIAPDWDLPFELMCDASDFAIGAVLGQRKNKHFQPIHYASKTMTEAQAHYTTTEKELLAVVISSPKKDASQDDAGGSFCFKNSMLFIQRQKRRRELVRRFNLSDLRTLFKINSENKEIHGKYSPLDNYWIGWLCVDKYPMVLLKDGVTYRLSTAYHPQTSGQVEDCPDSEASRARGFVLRSQELHILSFILGIRYPNLID
ncbi:reverse transcriptase domain-containing protein [Tanacetum coccineum]